MTENLLQKLEDKMMMLLTEVEESRKELQRLAQENALLKMERENHTKKLDDLLSLLDTVSASDTLLLSAQSPVMKPVLVQG